MDALGLAKFVNGSASDLSPQLQSRLGIVDWVVAGINSNYNEAVIISTRGSAYNSGTLHSSGDAFDLRIWENPSATPLDYITNSGNGYMSAEQAKTITSLLQWALGGDYRVYNERLWPSGQEVWDGPHIHVELNPRERPSEFPCP